MEEIIFSFPGILLHLPPARVAKLVDALCSGRSVGNHVLVRIQSRAQSLSDEVGEAFLFRSAARESVQVPGFIFDFSLNPFYKALKINPFPNLQIFKFPNYCRIFATPK
jgi:hypothetical protein